MSFTVLIRRPAQKKLQGLPRSERLRLVEKISALGCNPDDVTLDTRKLVGSPLHRMRVGDWRIIYDRKDAVRVIAIEKIKPRGDAYK